MGIKPKKGDSGKHIQATPDTTFPSTFYNYPIFCLKYLHTDYHLDKCERDEKVCLIDQLHKLSTLTWQQISQSGRHGLGFEKIHTGSIKAAIPPSITEDVTFLAFRFDGKKPFVGYRNAFIFHIIYIDRKYVLYNH